MRSRYIHRQKGVLIISRKGRAIWFFNICVQTDLQGLTTPLKQEKQTLLQEKE